MARDIFVTTIFNLALLWKQNNNCVNQSFKNITNGSKFISGMWKFTPTSYVEIFQIIDLVGLFTSMVFCTLSVIIILIRSKSRLTLPNKNFISLTVTLLIAYGILTCELLGWSLDYVPCYLAAVISEWAEMSVLVWLNVLTIDVWRSTRNLLHHSILREREQRKYFVYYCLYAWGGMSVFVGISVVVDNIDGIPIVWKPNYGFDINHKCYMSCLRYFPAACVYIFTLPILLSMSSLIFLIASYVNIRKTKTFENNKYSIRLKRRFSRYTQLTFFRDGIFLFGMLSLLGGSFVVINDVVFIVSKYIGLYLFFLFIFDAKKSKAFIVKLWYSVKRKNNEETS